MNQLRRRQRHLSSMLLHRPEYCTELTRIPAAAAVQVPPPTFCLTQEPLALRSIWSQIGFSARHLSESPDTLKKTISPKAAAAKHRVILANSAEKTSPQRELLVSRFPLYCAKNYVSLW